jgi:hypothetical protein
MGVFDVRDFGLEGRVVTVLDRHNYKKLSVQSIPSLPQKQRRGESGVLANGVRSGAKAPLDSVDFIGTTEVVPCYKT